MELRFRRILQNILTGILVLLTLALAFFSLITISFNFTHIKTNVYEFSMYPTLNYGVASSADKGDTVYINKYHNISRGDIVVAQTSWHSKPVIKRLVALPGDSLRIEPAEGGYNLIVNEKVLYFKPQFTDYPDDYGPGTVHGDNSAKYQEYLNFIASEENAENVKGNNIVLHEDEYFLMGDNWSASKDSLTKNLIATDGKQFNFAVNRQSIMGKVDVIVHVNENKLNAIILALLKGVFGV